MEGPNRGPCSATTPGIWSSWSNTRPGQAFIEMIQSAEYQAIAPLRTEAPTKGELHPLDQPAPSAGAS